MQNMSGRTARKTLVMTASSAMLATAATVGVVGGTTVSADAATVSKGYAYKCKATAGGTELGTQKVKVRVKTKLPAKIKAGNKLARRPISVSLRLPESLRKAATEVLMATHASGRSGDAALGVKIGKRMSKADINRLKAKKAPIPAEEGAAWKVKAKGQLEAIKVPNKAKGKVRLSVPKRFHVAAKLYRKDGSTVKSQLTCKGPKKRGYDSIRIVR
ncbi:MAG: DUF6801 domain-containing protein [Nocardioidaceae bacterium]